MIHYHGTPLTPKENLYKMAGKHFCVSFADSRDAKTCLEIGQSVMWDNGAFTTYTSGKVFDYQAYYDWLQDKLGHPHWAVIPDVIGGDEKQNKEFLNTWPYSNYFGVPVWHLHLSLDYLIYLCENYPKVCFGSSAQYWQVGSRSWEERVNDAFNMLNKKFKTLPWIHMLRGLNMTGKHYPFASADSVNVSRNYKSSKRCPEKMAREIDSVQCPIRWNEIKTKQLSLIDD